MAMDLRVPVALMFILLGVILAGYGLLAPRDVAPVDLGIPVNLAWGSLMCVFWAGLWTVARFSRRRE